MAEFTPNYNLRKPDSSLDYIDVDTDINDNMDILDTELRRIEDIVYQYQHVQCTAVETRQNTTTLADSNWASLPVAAGKKYLLRAVFAIGSSSASGSSCDIKIGFTLPASTVYSISALGPAQVDTTNLSGVAESLNMERDEGGASITTYWPFSIHNSGSLSRAAYFEGIIEPSVSGNLKMQFAQYALFALQNCTIGIGSFMVLEALV